MSHSTNISPASYNQLAGIPNVDLSENLKAALDAGKRATGIAADVLALRRGPGKLTPQEYFYSRLWDGRKEGADKRRFVGKIAQHPMHVAASAREWFAASADKILFHSIMDDVALPTPDLIAITQAGRVLPNASTIPDAGALATTLRDQSFYPLFAKQLAGKYSLSVLSADAFDPSTDEVLLLDGARRKVEDVAASLIGGAGFLVQHRLARAEDLAGRLRHTFGRPAYSSWSLLPDPSSIGPSRRSRLARTRPTISSGRAIGSAPSTWRADALPVWCMAPAWIWWSTRRTLRRAQASRAPSSPIGKI